MGALSNFSHRPIAVRSAMSGVAALGAVTYLPLTTAFRLRVQSGLVRSGNWSQEPAAVRLAINGWVPAPSAVTYLPLACDRRLTFPAPASITSNCSHKPGAARLGTRGLVPPFSAVTTSELLRDRKEITVPCVGLALRSLLGERVPGLMTVSIWAPLRMSSFTLPAGVVAKRLAT